MSKYMELKAKIEEDMKQLATLRAEERDAEITDMKKRRIAFDIQPDDLFSAEDLKAWKPKRAKRAVRYRWTDAQGDEHEWSGTGAKPKAFTAALASGKTEEQLRVAGAAAPKARPGNTSRKPRLVTP